MLAVDFDNKTGDALFDDTLKHALMAQIEDSHNRADQRQLKLPANDN